MNFTGDISQRPEYKWTVLTMNGLKIIFPPDSRHSSQSDFLPVGEDLGDSSDAALPLCGLDSSSCPVRLTERGPVGPPGRPGRKGKQGKAGKGKCL